MILKDLHCSHCGHRFEDLISRDAKHGLCTACGQSANVVISAPRVGLYNDSERRHDILVKRSHEHSVAEMKKNPERLATIYNDVPKSQTPWNIRNLGKR